eukprot:SAG31_NODE_30730_length_376_cov_31.743682_1_plen_39_part_10
MEFSTFPHRFYMVVLATMGRECSQAGWSHTSALECGLSV